MTTITTRGTKGSELTHNELDANFDQDVKAKTTTYACLVSDNRSVIECNHASTPFTVTLGDAATMAAADTGDYEVTIANIGAATVTVARAGSDTIDGAATSLTLPQYSSVTLKVNAATDGYNSIARGLGGLTSTVAELNILDGVTSTAAELNILDGVTSTAAELNKLAGVTSSAAELNILDGVTSTTAELNILDGVTSSAAELNILDGVTSTATELNKLDDSVNAVAGYDRGIATSSKDDVSYSTFSVTTNLANTVWGSIGPTGSGATDIWSGLDIIPAGATHAILKGYTTGIHSSTAYSSLVLHCRESGSAENGVGETAIASLDGQAVSGQPHRSVGVSFVPLSGANVFEAKFTLVGFATSNSADLILVGWIG